jgi:hypothetical protein
MKRILLVALTLPAILNIYGQAGFSNSGSMQIHTGTSMTVFADAVNNSTAAFVNNGTLYLRNNLSNAQAAMNAGTGTLIFNGSTAQSVNGTQVFKTYDLVTNNASGITLNNNLSVSNVHTYTAGMITTSATPNYLVYEAGSSYTGSNDSRHVNGWVKKLGNTNFTFPVGTDLYERSIALTNLTAVSEFAVKHNLAMTPDRYSLYNPLVYVDSAEHWIINKISGSAARVAMNWDHSKVPFPNLMISDIRAAYYDGVFWRSIGGSATGSALATGNVTSNSVTAFNTYFTFGSVSYVLPLQIISFTAGRTNDITKLNWTISNELNVNNYELQRSDDGINFYTIYLHNPYNRNSTEFYNHTDNKTLKGTAYYRLKVNSLGMQARYSNIVSVSAGDTGKALYVITNPVDSDIDLYADAGVKGTYNYTIATTTGQIMQRGQLEIKHTGIYSIPLKPLFIPGAYILIVQNEMNRLQKTIIKK